jgi:hypothetical protein
MTVTTQGNVSHKSKIKTKSITNSYGAFRKNESRLGPWPQRPGFLISRNGPVILAYAHANT